MCVDEWVNGWMQVTMAVIWTCGIGPPTNWFSALISDLTDRFRWRFASFMIRTRAKVTSAALWAPPSSVSTKLTCVRYNIILINFIHRNIDSIITKISHTHTRARTPTHTCRKQRKSKIINIKQSNITAAHFPLFTSDVSWCILSHFP